MKRLWKLIPLMCFSAAALLALSRLVSCAAPPALDDTEFAIKYKTVDGTWEGPLYYNFPSNTRFFIEGEQGGIYKLMYQNNDTYRGLLKKAVIDYRVVGKKLIIDTTAKKMELITPDTLR